MSITFVKLPDDYSVQKLPFYLAMEEWLAKYGREGEFLFLWRVNPTVIFGRNQQIEKEVNIEYCQKNNIQFYRRKSGGGCVYADMDNIMFSYITPSKSVETTFRKYTSKVASMLQSLGLDAYPSGRNDIMISDRKVSGNSFYHIPGRSIVHGTMLFSTNMVNMLNAITPSRSKLESKKVKSVESHITTISEHLPSLSITEFMEYASNYLTDNVLELNRSEIDEIMKMSETYYTHRWIWGHESNSQSDIYVSERRIEGVGEFHVSVSTDKAGIIKDVDLKGDFFITGDLDEELLSRLKGIHQDTKSIEMALVEQDVSSIIPGLSASQLASLIAERFD